MSHWKNILTRNTIKEAFDNLPAGLCFFNNAGLLTLCNLQMHHLFTELSKDGIQIESELIERLQKMPDQIYTAKDGSIWRFTSQSIISKPDNNIYTEYLASDVSQLHQTVDALDQKHADLTAMAETMERINKNVISIVREEEILSMKMQIHNDMGNSVLRTRRYYIDGHTEERKTELIERWRRTLRRLEGEIGKNDEVDPYEELTSIATSLGTEIIRDGDLPADAHLTYLLVCAMRECLTNLIRHAEGDKLFVDIHEDDRNIIAAIHNNGIVPTRKIVEGGGLSSLRKRIEKNGGIMQVQSLPKFVLTVILPKKGVNSI